MSGRPGRTGHDVSVDQITDALTDRLEELIVHFWPGARFDRALAYPCPRGDDLGSFQVQLVARRGRERGAWNRYSQSIGGNILNLVEYGRTGEASHKATDKYAATLQWARGWCDLGGPIETAAARQAREAERARRIAEAERHAAEQQLGTRAHVEAIWAAATPTVYDPPDRVARYLMQARRLPIERIRRPERLIRTALALEHWQARMVLPAMVAPVYRLATGADGVIRGARSGVHVTFLARAGLGKAALGKRSPKLMRGDIGGGIVPISRGPSGLSLTEAQERRILDDVVLVEGIETGLAAAAAIEEARVWACLSIANIGAAPVWHPAIGDVYVALEQDVAPAALAARASALEALAAHGRRVGTITPPIGQDLADSFEDAP